jgi:magnesium-transporting ATPase (P-type)
MAGLTPQLLPVIVTVALPHGAREMARRHVIWTHPDDSING